MACSIAQSSTFLAQVSGWLDRSLDGGRLGTDDGTDPADAVGAAWTFLSDARGSAALSRLAVLVNGPVHQSPAATIDERNRPGAACDGTACGRLMA